MTDNDYLPLVRKVARGIKTHAPKANVDDLIGEGCLGLVQALPRFNPSRGAVLSTYLGNRVRGAMLDHLRERDPLTRCDRGKVKQGLHADVIDVDEREAQFVPAPSENPARTLESQERQARVRRLLQHLPRRERLVVLEYYWHDRSHKDIGGDLGVGESRISQLHSRALEHLREAA